MDEEEKIFRLIQGEFRKGVFPSFVNDREKTLLRQVADIDGMEEAKHFLAEHADEFGPELRDKIITGIVDDMERREIMEEGKAVFDLALEHIKATREAIGDAEISSMTPSLLTKFLDEQFEQKHDLGAVKFILRGMGIPMQLEEESPSGE